MKKCPNCGFDPHELTVREKEVAILAAQGQCSKDSAQELSISSKTVDNHRESIYRKLDISGRGGSRQTKLAWYALQSGWLQVPLAVLILSIAVSAQTDVIRVTRSTNAIASPTTIVVPSAVSLIGNDISTPSNPSATTTRIYTKSGKLCSLSPAGSENCTQSSGGSGDFVGPSSSTDNAVVRFDSTTGKLGQNSLLIVDDSGNTSTAGTISAGVGGSVAGALDLGQGTLPSVGTTAITFMAPTAVTSYGLKYPGAAPGASQVLLWGAPSSSISTGVFTTVASANTASTIVTRDGSGNFTAGTITAALTGNASTATALAANPTNCSAGNYPLGIDASGNVESCTAASSISGLTTGTIPKAASASTLNDSMITQSGGALTILGASTTNVLIKAGGSQSGVVFEAQNSAASTVFSVQASGDATVVSRSRFTIAAGDFTKSNMYLSDSNTTFFADGASKITIGSTATIAFNDSVSPDDYPGFTAGTNDASISRSAAGTIAIGTGANGSVAGTLSTTGLTVAGSGVTYSGLGSATGTPDSVCLNTNTLKRNAALTCTVSNENVKNHLIPVPATINDFMRIKPVQFEYNDIPGRLRWGFGAMQVASVNPALADGWRADGQPWSLDQNAILALTVKTVQELAAKIQQLEAK